MFRPSASCGTVKTPVLGLPHMCGDQKHARVSVYLLFGTPSRTSRQSRYYASPALAGLAPPPHLVVVCFECSGRSLMKTRDCRHTYSINNLFIDYLYHVKTKEEIIDQLKALKEGLQKSYPIASISLFGSFARSEQTPDSDIDILVEFDGKVGAKFIDLANEVETSLGQKVDLVSKRGIKPHYLQSIEPDLIYV